MKKLLFALVALLFPSICLFAQEINPTLKGTIRYLDAKYAFRDAKFETPLDSFKNMILLNVIDVVDTETNKNVKSYYRSSDDLSIGEYPVQSITYRFYYGKLMDVEINITGHGNRDALLEMLKDLYGDATMKDEDMETYSWFGRRVALIYYEPDDDASIGITCLKLFNQYEDENKKNKTKAEDNGF